MPIEQEISEFPSSTDVTGENILHTKNRINNADEQCTVQDVVDLVPDPDLTEIVLNTLGTVDSVNDFVAIADASDSNYLKRVALPTFVTALSLPTTSGSVSNGSFNIGALQLRWGNEQSTVDTAESFTFNTAFSTECMGVFINRKVAGAGSALTATNYSTTGFDIDRTDAINGTEDFSYFAIGR